MGKPTIRPDFKRSCPFVRTELHRKVLWNISSIQRGATGEETDLACIECIEGVEIGGISR